jgi:phosphoenolpyruvate-protein phosphotransferase (PTS system enzyme I)
MKIKEQEICLKGKAICHGIAIGTPLILKSVENRIPNFILPVNEVEVEVLRYQKAIQKSIEDLCRLKKQLESEHVVEGAAILEAHQEMLRDPILTSEVEKKIRLTRKNAEFVFNDIIRKYQKKFSKMADPFFRERYKDLQDVARRIFEHLQKNIRFSLMNISPDSIIFAQDLTPADVLEAYQAKVLALVSQGGSLASHASIIAKARGIPYVANINFEEIAFEAATKIIVDGGQGLVVVNPNEDTLEKYYHLHEQWSAHLAKVSQLGNLPAETFDGYHVCVSANIDMLNETEGLHLYGGCGVGLFRSEHVFSNTLSFPTEEQQFRIYRSIIESMQGLPIVIRTFDIGADKWMHINEVAQEANPYLGCRAIRFLLKEKSFFKTQLRAIFRASIYGDVSVMFPMISSLSELREAKQILNEAKTELEKAEGNSFKPLRVGSMIEVPSAAIISDLIAKECDFLSIGTNDLVQYALAVDRDNHMMSNLYTSSHPSVIRLIKLVVTEANRCGIPVTVCGEIASDPLFTALLLGLGVHELSVAARHIPLIKATIRNTSILSAVRLAERILTLSTSTEIDEALADEQNKEAIHR